MFGGGGFIGRYVCEFLMKAAPGSASHRAIRGSAYFIQPLGQVGQFGFVRADISDADSVARAVEGATAVVNLPACSKARCTRSTSPAPGNVAEAAQGGEGRRRWSTFPRSAPTPKSKSDYGRTKGEGELAVRAAFPKATIIRPSLVFGPEDELTNRFASLAQLPLLPVIAPKTPLPAGLCPRPRRRRSPRRRSIRSAMAARRMRSAGRR